jgi:uncharacterized delta-60 repeat protein
MRSILRATIRLTTGLIVAMSWAAPAEAAPGDLDGSFSGDGWVWTLEVRTETNNYLPKGAEDLAIQPDGKIVAVGELQDGSSNWYFGVFRYLPGGELDSGFGDGGWVATDLASFEFAHAVALQPDGKIVVAGEGDCHLVGCFVLVRYNEDGSLDTSFSEGDGVVQTTFAQFGSLAFDVATQSNGRIVAAGFRFRGGDAQDDQLFAAARYLPDGQLDRTFSGDGRASLDLGYGDDIARAVAVLPRGKILVAGQGTKNRGLTEDDFALVRLRRDGTPDATFSGDGVRLINFGARRHDIPYSLDVQQDGKILVAGSSAKEREADPRFAIARLDPNGSLAGSFGDGGLLRFTPGPDGGYAGAVVQHPDGRILVAGRRFVDGQHDSSDWVILRYRPDGSPDPSFGEGGMVTTEFGTGPDRPRAMAVQTDGRIVVGGWIGASLGLARYLAV